MSIDFRILNQIEARRRQLKVLKYFSNPCMTRVYRACAAMPKYASDNGPTPEVRALGL